MRSGEGKDPSSPPCHRGALSLSQALAGQGEERGEEKTRGEQQGEERRGEARGGGCVSGVRGSNCERNLSGA